MVERIVDREQLPIDSGPTQDGKSRTLLAVGSVLHFAPPGATVWGTGVNFKVAGRLREHATTLDIRAVRGPISARTLERAGCYVPPIYGDPVLLVPHFFPEISRWKALTGSDVLVVPNLNDYERTAKQAATLGVDIINPTGPIDHVLKKIASAGLVIGSSLHAIAVADSLGVPARFVRSQAEHVLKYRDYLSGTARADTRIAADLEDAIRIGAHRMPEFSATALLEAFPRDLWVAPRADRTGSLRRSAKRARKSLRAWDPVIDAGDSDDAQRISTNCMEEALTDLREAAVKALNSEDSSTELTDDRYSVLRSAFVEAMRARTTAGSLAALADYSPDKSDLLAAIEAGSEELALRATWLDLAGPHAIGRVVPAQKAPVETLFVSLRPGRLRNRVVEWRLCQRRAEETTAATELPVFEVYRSQWSIDATVPLKRGADSGGMLEGYCVEYREYDGEWVSVVVEDVTHGTTPRARGPILRLSEITHEHIDDSRESS